MRATKARQRGGRRRRNGPIVQAEAGSFVGAEEDIL